MKIRKKEKKLTIEEESSLTVRKLTRPVRCCWWVRARTVEAKKKHPTARHASSQSISDSLRLCTRSLQGPLLTSATYC